MSQDETWYFSYGSNLSKQQMLRRTGYVPASRNAWLANYGLAFRKVLGGEDVYATIVPLQGAIVHGVAYRCSPYAMAQLDLFEGVAENCYRREPVQVSIQVGEVLACVVYIGEAFSTEISIPNANYLDSILTGAEEHQLPTDYIKWIRNIATDSFGTGPSIYRIRNP
jgi:gamma-glutamylcyclotransferase